MQKKSREYRQTQLNSPEQTTEKLKEWIPKLIKSANDYKNSVKEGNTVETLTQFCHTIRNYEGLFVKSPLDKDNKVSALSSLTMLLEEMELKRIEIVKKILILKKKINRIIYFTIKSKEGMIPISLL